MQPKYFIMPALMLVALSAVLFLVGYTGASVVAIAATLAAWSFVCARVTSAMAHFFLERDAQCVGLFVVLPSAVLLGVGGSMLILPSIGIALFNFIASFIVRLIVGAALPDKVVR